MEKESGLVIYSGGGNMKGIFGGGVFKGLAKSGFYEIDEIDAESAGVPNALYFVASHMMPEQIDIG